MTLALLLTAVTGAWAEGTVTVTEIKASEMPTSWVNNDNPVKATDLPGFTAVTRDEAKALGAPAAEGEIYVFYAISNNVFMGLHWNNGVLDDSDGGFSLGGIYALQDVFKFYYTGSAEAPVTVAWDAATKTGTFAMPGSDVVLTPIYAKAAAFATTGTEPEVKTLLPEAAEGVIAGTDASLIAEGTGIVAFAGESTEVTQGTLMYAIGTSATEAPALTEFSPTVPTAKDVADDGATLYVWYYIQGADAPDGEAATLDNTFDNTEPARLTVQVLTNKFDIQFNAANANTIEAGKATVTVGGTDKTVTEGKLQGVKMGSEVKMTAKEGYKFRKVEVKKKEAVTYPLLSAATTSDLGKVVCAAGHLHDAKTAVPDGCTAVGILGKVTSTGHGLILALQNATKQNWNTINGWTSASYAGTTLKVLPDDAARGTNLTSYTTLGETAVSNWAVAQKSDYEAIFINLGSKTGDSDGTTYDDNVNAYITGAGGTAISDGNWSATESTDEVEFVWYFANQYWYNIVKTGGLKVRPVLGF